MEWAEYSQFDNMRMPQQLEILDFTFDSSSHIAGDQLLAVDDLQSHLLTGNLVYRKFDLAKRALSQGLHNVILPESLAGSRVCAPPVLAGLNLHAGRIRWPL